MRYRHHHGQIILLRQPGKAYIITLMFKDIVSALSFSPSRGFPADVLRSALGRRKSHANVFRHWGGSYYWSAVFDHRRPAGKRQCSISK